MVQYAQQEAVEGTPQGENSLKNAAPNDTRFRPQGLERQASSECQSLVGQPTCKPTGFSRGYLTKSDAPKVGYAVQEVNRLSWFSKKNRRGVFLEMAQEKAKVYRTERGATSRAKWLNRLIFDYKGGPRFSFKTVEVKAK
jgi:hypothetical protein